MHALFALPDLRAASQYAVSRSKLTVVIMVHSQRKDYTGSTLHLKQFNLYIFFLMYNQTINLT